MKPSTSLGNCISIHTRGFRFPFLWGGIVLIEIILLVPAIVSVVSGLRQWKSVLIFAGGIWGFLVLFPLFLQVRNFRRSRISIHDYGLKFDDKIIRWDVIIGYEIKRIFVRRIVLYIDDQRKFTIYYNYYQHSGILLDSLMVRIYESIGNRYLNEIEQEGSLSVGGVKITAQGISKSEEAIDTPHLHQLKQKGLITFEEIDSLYWNELVYYGIHWGDIVAFRNDGAGITIEVNNQLEINKVFVLLDTMILSQPDTE